MIEEKKTVFGYLAQAFTLYGITMCIFILFGLLIGEYVKGVSSLFALGRTGLRFSSMLQLFGMSVLITLLRALFFTDILIKNMSVVKRTVSMTACIILMIVLFVAVFGWFPMDQAGSWIGFFVSFGICFALSAGITTWKEKAENRRMEEALRTLQEGPSKGEV